MSEFKITMRRAPGVSEEERRRRIHRAYQILIDAARRKKDSNASGTGTSPANEENQQKSDPEGDSE